MITISLHATPHQGGRGKFRVSGEAYGKDRTGREHIYDRIRLAVDGSEVDLYLDRSQVEELHRRIGTFLADNPLQDAVSETGRLGKAITRDAIEMPVFIRYHRAAPSTVVVPAGTHCMVLEHIPYSDSGEIKCDHVRIQLTVDSQEREIEVPIEQITFI